MRVLLAVANGSVRTLLSSYLRENGHEFEIVSDGLGCITSLCASHFNAVILEQGILWGGSDGVMSRMKEIAVLRAIPVILLSDAGFSFNLANLLRMEAFVKTPLKAKDLVRIGNILEGLSSTIDQGPGNQVIEQGAMR